MGTVTTKILLTLSFCGGWRSHSLCGEKPQLMWWGVQSHFQVKPNSFFKVALGFAKTEIHETSCPSGYFYKGKLYFS